MSLPPPLPALPLLPLHADAVGTVHTVVGAADPVRIVSLVPSLTELLCDLGLHPYLVGRTGFCIHPRALVQSVDKVGGTKDVNIERIRALAPTHLVVNIDENEKPTVAILAEFVPNVIVTHPQAPCDNLHLYRLFGSLFGALPEVAVRAAMLCERFQAAYDALLEQPGANQSGMTRNILYCIWQDPWMTVSRDTYIARMLELIGWQQWQPPQAAPSSPGVQAPVVRYPRFTWSDTLAGAIDTVLLSTEPYSFQERHADALEAQIGKPVRLVDGELLSWYGSRAIAGLAYLQALRADAGTLRASAGD